MCCIETPTVCISPFSTQILHEETSVRAWITEHVMQYSIKHKPQAQEK